MKEERWQDGLFFDEDYEVKPRKWWQDLLVVGGTVLGYALVNELAKDNQKDNQSISGKSFQARLKELEELKASGEITEEEYRLARKSLFQKFAEYE